MKTLTLQNRKGLNIVGDLEVPEGEIKGTCIVQHGWGSHRKKITIQTIKNSFLEIGFQTFIFDTTNSFGESDGDFEQSTLGQYADDLEDVVKWAQQQDWFTGPLALTGHSKGGFSILNYAENYPEEVSYLVPVAPVISGKLSFEANQKYNTQEFEQWKKDGVIVKIGSEGNTRVQHWFQMEERLNHDLLPAISNITVPVLVIVGSEDTSCPIEHQQILLDALSNERNKLVVLQGAPHSFKKESELNECKRAIQEWLLPMIA
jgi:pimeloyl-ACP methyl ester carboxylesterase